MKAWGSGDDGTTGLFGHERVLKDSLRPESYGTIDEATSALGIARRSAVEPRTSEIIEDVQRDLYVLMGEIATTTENLDKLPARIGQAEVDKLDACCAEIEAAIRVPNQFVLPGGCLSSAQLDLARTIVRRAERVALPLLREGISENQAIPRYLNRLSTLLYLLARYEDDRKGVAPVPAKRDVHQARTRPAAGA